MFQIAKLHSELEMVSGNVRVMSEMLTELVPTQAEPADLELLQVSKSRPPPGDLPRACPHTCLPQPWLAWNSVFTVAEVETRDFGLHRVGIQGSGISWFEQNSSSCLSFVICKIVLISPSQSRELSGPV